MFSGAGSLCSLQQLKVTDCARLEELPDGLGSSNTALELLHVNGEGFGAVFMSGRSWICCSAKSHT
jgi:hypothetical protein